MGDDWFGHRTVLGVPFGDRSELIDWDLALIQAVQTIEDLTDSNGLYVWELAEDGVSVDSIKTFDKFQASIDRKTSKKNYKPEPGEKWKARIKPNRARGDGEFQTIAEWRESLADGS